MALRDKYHCRHFLFSDESYPPALFKKVSKLLVDQNVGLDLNYGLTRLPAGHHVLSLTCVDANQHSERARLEFDVP